jgi:hypothetical protein
MIIYLVIMSMINGFILGYVTRMNWDKNDNI